MACVNQFYIKLLSWLNIYFYIKQVKVALQNMFVSFNVMLIVKLCT